MGVVEMSNGELQFVTLMFVDIPTAVSVRQTEGDAVANAMVEECGSLISVVRKKHFGKMIRMGGSSMICSFEGGDDALFAARGMQDCITGHNFRCEIAPALRIGLHAGDVAFRNGMCTGETVTTAARLVTLASAGQAVATEAVYSCVSPAAMEFMRPLASAVIQDRLKTKVYEVLWRPAPVLKMVAEAPVAVAAPRVLTSAAVKHGILSDILVASDGGKPPSGAPPESTGSGATGHLDFTPLSKELKLSRPWTASSGGVKKLSKSARPAADTTADGLRPKPSRRTVKLVMKRVPERKPIVLKEVIRKATDVAACLDDQMTAANTGPSAQELVALQAELCLIWQGRVIVVSAEKPMLKFGRQEDSDLVLTGDTASRLHGYIEFRSGEFYIVDHSWNGSFVYDEGGTEHFIKNDELLLGQTGALLPGCPEEGVECESILFWRNKQEK